MLPKPSTSNRGNSLNGAFGLYRMAARVGEVTKRDGRLWQSVSSGSNAF